MTEDTGDRYFRLTPEVNDLRPEFVNKSKKNDEQGIRELLDGTAKPFTGQNREKLTRTYALLLIPDTESTNVFNERVIRPISKAADIYGLSTIYPGNGDLPFHFALLNANFTNLTPEQIAEIKERLSSQLSHLDAVRKILTGLPISLDRLVISGATTYAASDFANNYPVPFAKAREIIYKIYQRSSGAPVTDKPLKYTGFTDNTHHTGTGLLPMNYSDILHATAMRMTEYPPGNAAEVVERIKGFITDIQNHVALPLENDPLKVRVDNVWQGTSLEFYQKYAPQLIK